jgi:DnaA N-terminal domain
MTSIEWYRVYHGMPEDAKLKVVAKRCGHLMTHVVTVWLCVLDAASRHKTRGTVQVDSEQIAVVQDIPQKTVEDILRTFYEKGMIDAKHRLTGWDKRQYATSTERSQKSRADKQHDATPRNTMQRDAADGNAVQRKNSKNDPDTESRVQIADAENRSADSRPDSDAEANSDKKKTNSDKKIRERAEKRESEREKQTSCGKQILQQMLDIWNAEVQSKLTPDQKAKLTPKRQDKMAQRWLDDFQQDMRAWKHYCEIIGASEFCLGRIAGKGWTIDLSWAVESSDHVAKILEGGFSGGNHPPKAPACDVPALQEAWDRVLEAFQKKYGKASGRSWLSSTRIIRILKYGDGAVVTMRCPSKFIQEWLTTHYLADLTRWFAEATKHDTQVTRLELIVEASV